MNFTKKHSDRDSEVCCIAVITLSYDLNTFVPKLIFTPVGAQGGGPLGPNHFKYFLPEFWYEICTISVYAYDNHKLAKRTLKNVPLQNGGQKKTQIFVSRK